MPCIALESDPAELVKAVVAAHGGKESILKQSQMGYRARAHIHYDERDKPHDVDGVFFAKGKKSRLDAIWNGDRLVLVSAPAIPDALVFLLSDDAKVSSIPAQVVERKACLGIRIECGDETKDLYIDPETHLIAKIGPTEYLDYKNDLGFPLPMACITYSGTNKIGEFLLSDVRKDDEISDLYFETEVLDSASSSATVPFEVVNKKIVVRARVNDERDLALVVDTGAEVSNVDVLVAPKITFVEEDVATEIAAGGTTRAGLIFIKSFKIGDVTIKNTELNVVNLHSMKTSPQVDGFIGGDILRKFEVTIDYASKTLTLKNPSPFQEQVAPGSIVLKRDKSLGAIFVLPGRLDDKVDARFLVDTGAGFNLLPHAVAEKLGLEFQDAKVTAAGVGMHTSAMSTVTAKSLQFGNLLLPRPSFLTPTEAPGEDRSVAGEFGIIGNPFWSQFKMTLDYPHDLLILEIPGTSRSPAKD